MKTLKAILFDLDGTLIDSEIDFQKMKRRTIRFLEVSGVKEGLLSEDMLNYDIENLALQHMRRNGVSEQEIEKIFHMVSEIMNEVELEALENVKIMDGVVDTLETLKKRGLKLGILTRGCREYVDGILRKFNLERLIDAVAARDDVSNPKPNPEHPRYLMEIIGVKPSETLLIGDHPMDALCARNVGIRYFLIPRRKSIPKQLGHETLRNISDLVDILIENG
jgi:phosphoglycolate phosphatase